MGHQGGRESGSRDGRNRVIRITVIFIILTLLAVWGAMENADRPAEADRYEAEDVTRDTETGGQPQEQQQEIVYHFRNEETLNQHFQKHGGEFGSEFGYETAQDYEEGANRVIESSEALHKLEAEDGDDVYYLEATNEFVVVSPQGVIRTYFRPNDGIKYYERQ